jgi:hypothetical protein
MTSPRGVTVPFRWEELSENAPLRVGLTNLTFALSIFCYLKLVPIVAEIQPFAALPAFLLITLYPNPLKRLLFAYMVVLLAALVASLTIAFSEDAYTPAQSIQSFAAVAAPVLIFVALLSNAQYLSPKLFGWMLALWTFIGFSQAYAPGLQSLLGLDSLFGSLISRYSPVSLSDWGRGATLLAPEPSYSARSVLLFLVAATYFWHRRAIGIKQLYVFLGAALFLAFVNQSATMAVMLLVYAAALLPLRVFVAICVAAVAALAIADIEGLRFVRVAALGYELLADQGVNNIVELTNTFGSQRTISVAVAYTSVMTGRFFGGGFGSWSVDFLNEMDRAGINISDVVFFRESLGYVVDIKPYSHFAMMGFELGVLGLFMDGALVLAAYRATSGEQIESRQVRRFVLATAAISLLFLATATPVSAPEFWVALAIALNLRRTLVLPRAARAD